ncbi:MAG: division plane positioning ATPase MipZ [Pseudomonadota bacterium]
MGGNLSSVKYLGNDAAHVIVVGNLKGGTGKSTVTMHVIVMLLKLGQRVASIDLDGRQLSLTRYVTNRAVTVRKAGLELDMPRHTGVAQNQDYNRDDGEEAFRQFSEAVSAAERWASFIVIDTPAADTYLSRVAHSMADTLITPLNDSFIDLDVLAELEAESLEMIKPSVYSEQVREARRQRRMADGGMIDWIVLRNRLSTLESRNNRRVRKALRSLSRDLSFRSCNGFGERVIYRELFLKGLTALDPLIPSMTAEPPALSHLSAREEVRELVDALKLPIDQRGRRRAEARRIWRHAQDKPLELAPFLETSPA